MYTDQAPYIRLSYTYMETGIIIFIVFCLSSTFLPGNLGLSKHYKIAQHVHVPDQAPYVHLSRTYVEIVIIVFHLSSTFLPGNFICLSTVK